MKKIIFTILCFFAITMVAGIACASDADNLTANETDLGEILTVGDNVNVTDLDVNDTVSVNNSCENITSGSIPAPKINGSKLVINGPKLPINGPKIKGPFPYNLRDNPTYNGYIDRWSNHFQELLEFMSFDDAYSQLIHDYMWDFLMYDNGVYYDFCDNPKSYVGIMFLVVNKNKSFKNQISYDKIEDDIFDAYDAWNDQDDYDWVYDWFHG